MALVIKGGLFEKQTNDVLRIFLISKYTLNQVEFIFTQILKVVEVVAFIFIIVIIIFATAVVVIDTIFSVVYIIIVAAASELLWLSVGWLIQLRSLRLWFIQ